MSYGGRNDSFGPKPVETGREYDVTDHRKARKATGLQEYKDLLSL